MHPCFLIKKRENFQIVVGGRLPSRVTSTFQNSPFEGFFICLSLAFPVYPVASETVYRSNSYEASSPSDYVVHRALFFWANQLIGYF